MTLEQVQDFYFNPSPISIILPLIIFLLLIVMLIVNIIIYISGYNKEFNMLSFLFSLFGFAISIFLFLYLVSWELTLMLAIDPGYYSDVPGNRFCTFVPILIIGFCIFLFINSIKGIRK